MWCTSCANAVERALKGQPGVVGASVSFAAESARVAWDTGVTTLAKLVDAVRTLGYEVSLDPGITERTDHIAAETKRLGIRLAVALLCAMWGMTAQTAIYIDPALDPAIAASLALFAGVVTLPVVFYSGFPFLRAGWRTIRAGAPGMDVLISLGSLGALMVSFWKLTQGSADVYFDTAGMLITLLLLARLIDFRMRQRTAFAVQALLTVTPQVVRLLDGQGTETSAPLSRTERNAKVVILPGETVPVDGVVVEGQSELDRSLLSGETTRELVRAGDVVEAGSVNSVARIVVNTTHPLGERRIDQIAARVREMLARKSSLQALTERIARALVPTVVVFAVLGLGLALMQGEGWNNGTQRALAVVVITCPCALALAVPLALIVAVNCAASAGAIIQDGSVIEKAANLDTFYFDKTGTLTLGKPTVAAVIAGQGVEQAEVLACAARAEAGSEHPFAVAIRAAAPPQAQGAASIRIMPGEGVVYDHAGESLVVGNAELLRRHGIEPHGVQPHEASIVHVARNGRAIGYLLLTDAVRPEAVSALETLKTQGFRLALLTGDQASGTRATAGAIRLGQDVVHTGLSPEGKAERVLAAQRAGQRVMFVGDGLNDGPALAAADVGVAVAGAATPSIAAAPIILRRGGAEQIPMLLDLFRRTNRIMRQNVAWAVGYNLCAVPLALLGYIPPLVAAIAMVFSSLSVSLNSARLLKGDRLE